MKTLLKALAALIVALVATSFFIPNSFEIVRTHTIHSSHPRVIHQMANIKSWPEWWPWNREEQNLLAEGESQEGPGKMSWSGRPAPGHLVLTKSTIYSIEYDVFLDGHSTPLKGSFDFKPVGDSTEVTWRVKGSMEKPIVGPYLALLADSMHGGMLSWGLKQLSEKVEGDKSDLKVIYEDSTGKEVEESIP